MDKIKEYNEQVVSKFYTRQHLMQHVEREYSDFLEQYLPQFFERNSKLFLARVFDKKQNCFHSYYLEFGKVSTSEVKYSDQNRNIRKLNSQLSCFYNLTRELKLFVEAKLIFEREGLEGSEIVTKKKKSYQLGRIPLLINSKFDTAKDEAPFKPYYYIINGAPKVLNHLVQQKNFQKIYKKDNKVVKLRISNDLDSKSGSLEYTLSRKKRIFTVNLGYSKTPISVFQLLKFLGMDASEVLLRFNEKNLLDLTALAMIEDGFAKDLDIITEELYTSFLKKREEPNSAQLTLEQKKVRLDNFFKTYYLRNVRQQQSVEWKEFRNHETLDIITQLVEVQLGRIQLPFLDSPENKRLMGTLKHFQRCFNESFKVMIDRTKTVFLKQMNSIKKTKDLSHLFKPQIIKKAFKNYLVQGKSGVKQNHSEALSVTNNHQQISCQRKVISPLNKTIVHATYRSINPLKPGRLCPVTTPYSRSVGLVEYLSLGAKISKRCDTALEMFKSTLKIKEDSSHRTKLMLDQRFLGYTNLGPKVLLKKLNCLKKKSTISFDLIPRSENQKEYPSYTLDLRISEGRILKPFYVVSHGKPRIYSVDLAQLKQLNLKDLVLQEYVTYLDAREQLNAKIAPTLEDVTKETQYTYVDPTLYLSYLGSVLPTVNINAAHRASLSLRLISQSLGTKKDKQTFNYNALKAEYMVKSNPSIYATYFDKYNLSKDNVGQNLVLGYWGGQNEEDAIYVNKSALERGLLDHVVLKKIKTESKKDEAEYSNRYDYLPPDGSVREYLEQDGLPKVGTPMVQETVLNIYSEMQSGAFRQPQKNVKTRVLSPSSNYRVKQVILDSYLKDSCEIEISFKKLRSLTIGNKLGTRSGLKGVVSRCLSQLDLNIPSNGINASVFFSNHVINSRMTLGPLLELYFTKYLVLKGQRQIQTSFLDPKVKKQKTKLAEDKLVQQGMDPRGYQDQYDVNTFSNVKVFMGPTKILLLEHHSKDKSYVRTGSGGVSFLTRQPGEGRSVKGGLRIGQMQCNALIEHTATEFIKDKLGVDLQKVRICSKCGLLTDQLKEKEDVCRLCNSFDNLVEIKVPYAFVLLTKILRGGHIETVYHTSESLANTTQENLPQEASLNGSNEDNTDIEYLEEETPENPNI